MILLSSDDIMKSTALEEYAEIYKSYGQDADRVVVISGVDTIDENSKVISAYNTKGTLLEALRKDKASKSYNKALENFGDGIKIDPEHIDAHFGMGVTYKVMGETDKALEYFEKTVKLYPKHAEAYLDMGIIYSDREEWQKASEAFEKVVELEPDNKKAQKVLEDLSKILELAEEQGN